MPRRNPLLISLTNPAPAPRAWQRFHGRGPSDAETVTIPDIPGLPRMVWCLGFFVGLEGAAGWRVRARWTYDDGPWIAADAKDPEKLWIVARDADRIGSLDAARGPISAILYIPSRTSGKYVAGSPYRHLFGEGGPLPRDEWSSVFPHLRQVAPNAFQVVRPRGGFRVLPGGITG